MVHILCHIRGGGVKQFIDDKSKLTKSIQEVKCHCMAPLRGVGQGPCTRGRINIP